MANNWLPMFHSPKRANNSVVTTWLKPRTLMRRLASLVGSLQLVSGQSRCASWWKGRRRLPHEAGCGQTRNQKGETMKRLTVILPLLITLVATLSLVRDSLADNQKKETKFVGVFQVTRADLVTKGPKPEELPVIRAHVEYWQQQTDRGVCLLAGHTLNTDETAFGLAVIKADSEAAAKKIMEDDPMVRA